MVRLQFPVPEVAPERIRLVGERRHYLADVLRLGPGDALEVFDGQGRSFEARVESSDAESATVSLRGERRAAATRALIVLQGLPKSDKLEWIIQKCTELGAGGFAPVSARRSVVKLEGKRAEERVGRWRKIAEEASRQSGRSEVPRVEPVRELSEAIASLPKGCALFVLDEEEKRVRLAEAFAPLRGSATPVALAVGPEGGWEREEIQLIRERGGVPVGLGPRILRTETAAMAALAVLLHLDGELG